MPKERKIAIQHTAPMTRRQRARWEKERTQQQQVLLAVGVILGLALVLVVGGIVWQRLIIPSRTVASVGTVEISNGEYQKFRQLSQATGAIQQANLLSQYTQYGLTGTEEISQEIVNAFATLSSPNQPLDYARLNQLVDHRVVLNGAADAGVTVTDEQVIASLAEAALGQNSPPPTDPLTPTDALTDTAGLTPTAPLTPTETPTQTPAEAANTVDVSLRSNYQSVVQFFTAPSIGLAVTPLRQLPFTYEDFKSYAMDLQRDQLMRTELGKQLVDEASVPKEMTVDADQIFVKVTSLPTDTAEISATLWADGLARITDIQSRIAAGAEFNDLVKSDSDFTTTFGSTSSSSGLQPLSYWGQFQITEPVSTQPVGVVGEPYRSTYGWHLVRVNQRSEQPNQSELDQKRGEAIAAWVTDQREKLGVKLFPEPTATPVPPTLEPSLDPNAETPPDALPAATSAPDAAGTPETTVAPAPTPEPTLQVAGTPEATVAPAPTPEPTP